MRKRDLLVLMPQAQVNELGYAERGEVSVAG